MKIFVNGAAGYVGRNLVNSLSDRHDVMACDILSCEQIPDSVKKIVIPIDTDTGKWKIFFDGCDVVINLAQYPDYKAFPDKADEMFNTNVQTPLRMLEAARQAKVKKFILFSSGGIYGSGPEKFHELKQLNPLDFYLATKGMAELIARKYRPYMAIHIVRPFFIYGPGQKGKLIPNIIDNIKKGLPVHLKKDNGGKINPVFIYDVLKMTESLFDPGIGHSTTNFAGPDIVSIKDIIDLCSEILNKKAVIQRTEEEPLNMVGDITRILEICRITPTPFKVGLAKTIGK